MQGERSILDSFPETIDLNQGSASSNANMDRSAAWDSLLNPVENRLSNYALSSGEGNVNCTNPVSRNAHTLSGWDHGESSSGANSQNQLDGHDLKIGHGWPSSVSSSVVSETRSPDWRFVPPNLLLHDNGSSGYGGNYLPRPLNPGSSRSHLSANISRGYTNSVSDGWEGGGSVVSPNLYKPGGSEMEHFPAYGASSEISGAASGSSNYFIQNDDGSGSSSGTWGLSCKRKALEGAPGQSSSCGNVSTHPQNEHVGRHAVPTHYNASRSLTISAQPMNSPSINHQGQLNQRIGVGMGVVASDGFPPLSVSDIGENSHQRNFLLRAHLGQQESVPPSLSPAGTDVRHSSVHNTFYPRRLISTPESPELRPPLPRSMTSNNAPNQTHVSQVPGSARNMVPNPFSGSPSLLGVSSTSSLLFSGERGTSRDEATFRNSLSNADHSGFVSAPETRHLVQESPNWSFAPANRSSSRNVPSSSRVNPGSSSRSFPTVWVPHQNPTAHNHQRLSEFSSWSLFPPVEAEPGVQRGYLSSLPSRPSSSEEASMSSGSSSGAHSQPYSRSVLIESSNDDVNGWRALAAGFEGRHRLVSEVSNHVIVIRVLCSFVWCIFDALSFFQIFLGWGRENFYAVFVFLLRLFYVHL